MKQYRGIISDFDSTLAGSDITINEPVVAAVRRWMDSGKSFSIATGRQFNGAIKRACTVLDLTTPQIVRGGAEIIDPKTEKVLSSTVMPDDAVKEIVAILLARNYAMWVEKDDAIYTPEGEVVAHYDTVPFKDLEDLVLHTIPKIHIRPVGEPERIAYVEQDLMQMFPQLHFIQLHYKFGKSWDVTASDATKQMAVLRLAAILDCKPDALIGIGDGYNDYSLLSACGYKVAVDNAVPELKAIADMIAPSVTDDGVAAVINRFLID